MSKSNDYQSALLTMSKEALDNLPFGAYLIDKEGNIEFFNKAMADISGVKEAKKIVGQNVYKVPSYEKYGLLRFIKRGLKGRPFRIKGIQYISHVGKKESFRDYYGIPIKNESGEVQKLLCIVEDMTRQRKLEDQVVSDLREKEVLLKEAQHRAKNNIRVIDRMFNSLLGRVDDPKAKELLQVGKDQVKNMMDIHDKLYQAEDWAEIGFAEYLKSLVISLFVMHNVDSGRIKYKVEVGKISIGVDRAIPCALIVNELVTNSLKYAFPDKREGEIFIKLNEVDNNYELEVGDNGVGFTNAMDINSANSLGITLVNTLAEEMKGNLNLVDQQGIKARIKFPK